MPRRPRNRSLSGALARGSSHVPILHDLIAMLIVAAAVVWLPAAVVIGAACRRIGRRGDDAERRSRAHGQ
jgi:hypothetical protein